MPTRRRYPPQLTIDQERALAARVHGDAPDDALAARNALVEANLPFVYWLIPRLNLGAVPFEDAIQAGASGLIRAAATYDGRVRFCSYAAFAVRQSVQRAAQGDHLVHLPAWVQRLRRQLEKSGGEAPDRYREFVRDAGRGLISIDRPGPDEESEVAIASSSEPPAVAMDRAEEWAVVERAIADLDPTEAEVLRLRYLGGQSQREIGRRIRRTHRAVGMIEQAALEKVRAFARERLGEVG